MFFWDIVYHTESKTEKYYDVN